MKSSEYHFPSLLSTLVFAIAALLLFGVSLIMGAGVLMSLFRGMDINAQQTIFLIAFGFEGLVLLAAALFTLQKFLQKPAAERDAALPAPNWLVIVAILVTALSILIGYQIREAGAIRWILLPLLTVPAIVLPLGVLLAFGTKRLPFGTRWQAWSVLGLSMSLAPLILFILEIIAAIVILLIVGIYVGTQPDLAEQFQALSRQISVLGPNSEAVLELMAPFLTDPAVILTALLYMAVIVPAIEEIFKPLGVWLLAGRLTSQAQGFALGALSGAGYALIETIGVSGQTEEWASLLFTRIGTGLLHVTTSALMGGAIFAAWRQRRYAYLFGTYLLAVLLHGLWNMTAVLFSFSTIADFLEQEGLLSTLQPTLLITMGVLAAALFVILVVSRHRLRKTLAPPAPPPPPAIPSENATTGEASVE